MKLEKISFIFHNKRTASNQSSPLTNHTLSFYLHAFLIPYITPTIGTPAHFAIAKIFKINWKYC